MTRGSILIALLLASLLGAALHAAPASRVPASRVEVGRAEPGQTDEELRFETVELVLDPVGETLAAWQVRLVDPSGRATVVGIEGGEDPAYAEPPFHDPEALAGGELVLAAYDTSGAGPRTETRVARLHLAVRGAAPATFEVTVEVAAAREGAISGATARIRR